MKNIYLQVSKILKLLSKMSEFCENKKSINDFFDFMNKHYCDDIHNITHKWIGYLSKYNKYKGQLSISDEEYDHFLELYTNASKNMIMYLEEYPKDDHIFYINISISPCVDFTNDIIMKIVDICKKYIFYVLKIEVSCIYICQKSNNSLLMYVPNIFIDNSTHNIIIGKLVKTRALYKMFYPNAVTVHKLTDGSLMYSSCDTKDSKFLLKYVYKI